MFIERKFNSVTDAVELWKCEWENRAGQATKKVFIEKVAEEQPLVPQNKQAMSQTPAICWSYGRTLGNIAVFTPSMLGSFAARSGDDAILPCEFVSAGKFRHGNDRWWCRTHQSHWGTKADYESYERSKVMICANHDQLMNYVVAPYALDMSEYAEVGVWCSMPAALSTRPVAARPPKIHVHVRPEVGATKTIDRDFDALAVRYGGGLFGNEEITQVNITPPAAFEFVRALEFGRPMDCINCTHCGYPHLDLGDFAERPHRKHFCANCGRDSTWSSSPIVSTPLKPMHDQFAAASKFVEPDRTLNLDEHIGCNYTVWASTPAILWTADRPQEKGIHVHVHNGLERIVDDTFSEVLLGGEKLSRRNLIEQMVLRTII
ncbi:MAG: hypothetical protein ACLQME_18365 [Alphaproteobacteria bacterium]